MEIQTANLPSDPKANVEIERMLKWFEYKHLPGELKTVSREFSYLAHWIVDNVPCGPERTVSLRKLLEAKDAGVRAKLQ